MKKITLVQVALIICSLNACLVPPATEENSTSIKGKVIEITKGSSYDVVLKFEGEGDMYYINRGLENGRVTMSGLKEKILNKEVLVKYAEMNINVGSHHIYEVRLGDEIIYTEMKDSKDSS